jgi:hypothetical protein
MTLSKRSDRPWLNYLLAALCVGVIIAAYTTVGAASQDSDGTEGRRSVHRLRQRQRAGRK